jgi:hypothetical protein
MGIKEFTAALLLFCFFPIHAIGYEDENRDVRLRGYASKSATAAFTIGLIPGFFAHGAGHYYIGDKKTGNILLATGAVSTPLILLAIADGLGSIDTGNENKSLQAAGGAAMIVFIGGWAIDFLDAPNKVIDSRRALKAKPQISMNQRQRSIAIKLAISF